MNQNGDQGTVSQAIMVIIFFFLILIFLLLRFGGNSDSVSNPENENKQDTKKEFLEKIQSSDDQDIYNKYVKQIYDVQSTKGNSTGVSDIIQNYENELLQKTQTPTQNIILENINNKYNPKSYRNDFETIFEELKKASGTSESALLSSQIASDGTLLPLSDYDREKILEIASTYETFVSKLVTLNTPASLESSAKKIATAALNVSYILRQMVKENDPKIYSLWISKYSENMFAIIEERYALQQK